MTQHKVYKVCIIPNNTTANLSLSYRKFDDACSVYENFENGMSHDNIIKGHDDFGYRVAIRGTDISYILFVNVEDSQECEFEQMVCTNLKKDELGKRLQEMGYTKQDIKRPSPIIQ
jgi:hypothetical protein